MVTGVVRQLNLRRNVVVASEKDRDPGSDRGYRVLRCSVLTEWPNPLLSNAISIYGGTNDMSISVGQKAPDFTLQNQDKKEVKLSDYAGKKNVVLMWYPLDFSPVCTNEHACVVNDMKSFDTLDAEVLGISVDSLWAHKAFADKMGIKYSLLADFHPKGAVSEKYGTYLADKGITGRAIAIVNKDGNVAWFKNYDIPVVPDIKEVAAALTQVKSASA
jgi:peroxiredoxin